MAAKELWHDTAPSVNTKSQRVVHVHSPLIDTERSNPLISPISCRRLFFSPLRPPHSPRVRIFCVGAHRKFAWAHIVEPLSHIKPPLCVCVFVCLRLLWPVWACLGRAEWFKKKKKIPPTSSSLRHTEVCRNAVNLWIFSLLTLKHIFWKLPKTTHPPHRRARGWVDIVVQQNKIVSGGFQQRTGLTTALSPAKVFIFSLFTVELNGVFFVIEPCIPANTLSFMSWTQTPSPLLTFLLIGSRFQAKGCETQPSHSASISRLAQIPFVSLI